MILLAMILAVLPVAANAVPTHCGTERWPVKTLTDPNAAKVDLTHVKTVTVEQMRALRAPHYNDTNPRNAAERTVYRITARLVGFKMEADQDFHVVIAGQSGDTMIVEFTNPPCAIGSRVAAQIAAARTAFVARFGQPLPRFKRYRSGPLITITGVGFFDKIHGQTGVAPNGVELHPVLDLR